MKVLRDWMLAERLLDEVWHNPDLANDKTWRGRAFSALPGCPHNHPEGTYAHPVEQREE